MTGQAFGHLGFSNILCWADPERDISVYGLTTGEICRQDTPSLLLAQTLYQILSKLPKDSKASTSLIICNR